MNARRAALLHRERAELLTRLAHVDEQIALAFEEEPAPTTKPRRRVPIQPPDMPSDDLTRARARRALRRAGVAP